MGKHDGVDELLGVEPEEQDAGSDGGSEGDVPAGGDEGEGAGAGGDDVPADEAPDDAGSGDRAPGEGDEGAGERDGDGSAEGDDAAETGAGDREEDRPVDEEGEDAPASASADVADLQEREEQHERAQRGLRKEIQNLRRRVREAEAAKAVESPPAPPPPQASEATPPAGGVPILYRNAEGEIVGPDEGGTAYVPMEVLEQMVQRATAPDPSQELTSRYNETKANFLTATPEHGARIVQDSERLFEFMDLRVQELVGAMRVRRPESLSQVYDIVRDYGILEEALQYFPDHDEDDVMDLIDATTSADSGRLRRFWNRRARASGGSQPSPEPKDQTKDELAQRRKQLQNRPGRGTSMTRRGEGKAREEPEDLVTQRDRLVDQLNENPLDDVAAKQLDELNARIDAREAVRG